MPPSERIKIIKIVERGRRHYLVKCLRTWEWVEKPPLPKKFSNKKAAEQYAVMLLLGAQFQTFTWL